MPEGEESLAVRRFFAVLKTDDDEAIEGAVHLLAPSDEGALLVRLAGAEAESRWWLLRALAHCGSATALPAVAAATHAATPALRVVATMTLGRLVQRRPEQAAPYWGQLTAGLSDEDGMVRQVATDSLAQCGNAAIAALVQVLRFSENQGARSRAAAALSKIRTPEAAGPLYRCLNDPNYLVHTYAYEALDDMGLLENTFIQF